MGDQVFYVRGCSSCLDRAGKKKGDGERSLRLSSFWVTGGMAAPLAETGTQRKEYTEWRWGKREFDLGHPEFEVPMGKQLSNGQEGEKQIWELPARKWLSKSVHLDEISRMRAVTCQMQPRKEAESVHWTWQSQ